MDEKDRFGEKLRQKEKAEEDRYIAERDKELIERLRKAQQAAEDPALREQARMRCPKCGERLSSETVSNVTVEACPACRGMWLDRGELEQAVEHEKAGWFTRYLDLIRSR